MAMNAVRRLRLAEEVRAVISELHVEGQVVRIEKQLDRPLYEKVNKVLEAMGGKWDRRKRGHFFADDPADRIENVLLTGEVVDLKKAYDFFETPRALVEIMIVNAGLKDGQRVLEPSAGGGAIVDVVHEKFPGCRIRCAEAEPGRAEALRKRGYLLWQNDFLKIEPSYEGSPEMFDCVLMNPPFSKQQDIDHVMHAHRFLKPGGVLVAVMSAGVKFRMNRKTLDFRRWMQERERGFEELPEGSFKASGTGVNTVLVTLGA